MDNLFRVAIACFALQAAGQLLGWHWLNVVVGVLLIICAVLALIAD